MGFPKTSPACISLPLIVILIAIAVGGQCSDFHEEVVAAAMGE